MKITENYFWDVTSMLAATVTPSHRPCGDKSSEKSTMLSCKQMAKQWKPIAYYRLLVWYFNFNINLMKGPGTKLEMEIKLRIFIQIVHNSFNLRELLHVKNVG